jgi:hypothetical protein
LDVSNPQPENDLIIALPAENIKVFIGYVVMSMCNYVVRSISMQSILMEQLLKILPVKMFSNGFIQAFVRKHLMPYTSC